MRQQEKYTGIQFPHSMAEKNSMESYSMQNLEKYSSAEQLQHLLRQHSITKRANSKLEHRAKSDGKKIKILAEIVNTQQETIAVILQKVGHTMLLF